MTRQKGMPFASRRGESGQSLVESAMVIPLILLMFMGSLDVGRLLFAYIALEEAVQEGATYGSYATGVSGWRANIKNRVTTSSNHSEVTSATVPDPVCVPENTATTPPTPGTVTVVATSNVPLLTPVGSVLFGGTFQLRATVIATNLDGSCVP